MNKLIPFPFCKDTSLYRRLEQKIEHVDKYVIFSKNNNRSFTSSLCAVELYIGLYNLINVREVNDEQKAMIKLLNMIRLYMNSEERIKLNKGWLRC